MMCGVFVLMLLFWAGIPAMLFGQAWALNPAATAFLGLALLLIFGVLKWVDILNERVAWDTIIWFSGLVMMATFLNKLGVIAWFSDSLQNSIGGLGLHWTYSATLLLLAYLYTHYLFASTTAHITAMFAAFYTAGLALGAPPMLYALMMAAVSSLMMTLTHFATGTSPVIFGSGYTTLGEWWKAGFIMSVVNLFIFVTVGSVWWKVLGYW
jgi:DASS family divalent anion:Na+ symporter